MLNKMHRLREERANGENGFTLIELLVVVVIIGILIAIAIPLYLNYQKGANDKAAQSDLRGTISVLEQCNSDNSGYPSAMPIGTATTNPCTGTVNTSSGTTLNYYPNGTNSAYILFSTNSNGNVTAGTAYYCYASSAGGPVIKKTGALPAAFAAAC